MMKGDPNDNPIELPLDHDTLLRATTERSVLCQYLSTDRKRGNIIEGQLYKVQNKLLKRYVTDGDKTYETTVLPRALTAQILKMAHDNLGS